LRDARNTPHEDDWRLDGARERDRKRSVGQNRQAAAEREICCEAGTVDAMRDKGVPRLRVIAMVEVGCGVMRARCAAQLERDRAVRRHLARIANDRRQYVQYQRQPYKPDPSSRPFHCIS